MIYNVSNCILTNGILFSGDPIDSNDVALLRDLRSKANPEIFQNYSDRSEILIARIKEVKGHTIQTWKYYKTLFLDDALTLVRNGQDDEAILRLQQAAISIEQELNILLWFGGVSADSYMSGCQKQTKDLVIGDTCLMLATNLNETIEGTISEIKATRHSLVTLVSESGIKLTCSYLTPMTLEFGQLYTAGRCLGKNIPVMDNGAFRWEACISVTNIGLGWAYNIKTSNAENVCYGAGDELNKYIWTQRL